MVINNRVLLQWGSAQFNTYSTDINLPTSYSSINYAFCIMDQNNSLTTTATQDPVFIIASTYKTTSSIRIVCTINSIQITNWICIGS